MDSVNITKNFEEVCEEYDQVSILSNPSDMQKEILQSENESDGFFKGLFFAIPISLFMWALIIWVFL